MNDEDAQIRDSLTATREKNGAAEARNSYLATFGVYVIQTGCTSIDEDAVLRRVNLSCC